MPQTLPFEAQLIQQFASDLQSILGVRKTEIPSIVQHLTRLAERLRGKPVERLNASELDRGQYVEVVVMRNSCDETSLAVVRCRKTKTIRHDYDVLRPVRQAVTAWIKDTAEGRREWSNTSYDFNIGDLGVLLPDEKLEAYLTEEGIFDFTVEIISSESRNQEWYYDLILPLTKELNDEKENHEEQ